MLDLRISKTKFGIQHEAFEAKSVLLSTIQKELKPFSTLFVVFLFNSMPVRLGKARLWFNTKEEQDEYDDNVISNIELTTDDEADDNYCLMFVRKKKESFLTLNRRAVDDINRLNHLYNDPVQFIDKYLAGKRDHTINRQWNINKGMFAWVAGYLLLRELPVRNFYARSFIMIFALGMYHERKGTLNLLQPMYPVIKDQFTHKNIRNYQAYVDMTHPIIPHASNKISEAKVWQLNQPAYMKEAPECKISELTQIWFPPKQRIVAWDGTFNMPLEGLAHPLHKDGKHIDFTWWEY